MRPCEAPTKRVFICSRYAGEVTHNTEVAVSLCMMAIELGLAPFAPHLLYAQFLNDADPCERELGISLGLQFMEVCDEVWVYIGDGISDGMHREIAHARLLDKCIVEIREVLLCART